MPRMYVIFTIALLVGLSLPAEASVEIMPSSETTRGKAVAAIPSSVQIAHMSRQYDLNLLGSGVRKQLMFKVYEGAAYADVRADLSDPVRAMMGGDHAKHMRLTFLRETTGQKVQSFLTDCFRQSNGPKHEFEAELNTLLSYLGQDVGANEVITFTWLPGQGLFTEVRGEPHPLISGDGFARALMSVWFGEQPVSAQLKKDLTRLVGKSGS